LTVQISYAGAVIYTGVLKAIGYSMTKLVCTLYNSVYELLQRRDYVGKWTSTAANVILSDITGSGGVGSDSFGNTTAESGEDYTNYGHKEGPRYQMIAISGATITSIKAYVKVDSASNAKIAVYSDSSGSPSALLGVSNEVNVTNTTYAWITFTFGTPVAVTASAYYWFIIMTDNAVYWATNWSGSTPHKVGNEVYSDGFSDPFGSITNSYTSHDSFYAVLSIGTPGGGECPTTVVSVDYDAVAFDCAVNLAKILSKNYWGDTIGNFNIGVRNSCKLAFTFDENNGTIVNDLSGFANHGTIYPTPSSFTFGRTDTGNTTQGYSANQKAANIFTAGATGQLSKITVRLKRNTTSGKARAALYANSSGAPGALIAQTQEVTVTTTTGWFDFPFLLGAYPSVVNGTAYWLAILTDEAYTLRVNNTTGTINYNADTYSDGFANPFGTPSTTASRQICIYATGATPSPTWITGKYGGALSLLGSSSYYVSVPAASSLSITGDVTVALWIRRTGTDTGYPQLASKVSNTGQIAWGIHAVTGTYHPYMVARIGNVEYNTVSPNALPLNVWTFVVGVRRGTTLEIWENAVLVNSNVAIPASAMDANNTGAFRINFDAGSIGADHDELLVINRALAAEEILFMTNFVQQDQAATSQ
jgi:hypothetical protein